MYTVCPWPPCLPPVSLMPSYPRPRSVRVTQSGIEVQTWLFAPADTSSASCLAHSRASRVFLSQKSAPPRRAGRCRPAARAKADTTAGGTAAVSSGFRMDR